MSRQKVVVVKCDRCRRDELQPVPEVEKTEPDLDVTFKGEKLQYADLCAECENTVKKLFEEMKQWERKINPLYRPVDEGGAPPLEIPATYSPPKPHSPGANKK